MTEPNGVSALFSVAATVQYLSKRDTTRKLTRSCPSNATKTPSRHRVAPFSVTETAWATLPIKGQARHIDHM
jgi:hypothetical protein